MEFETSSGKQSALEASPITIGDRQVVLEEKKTNSRGINKHERDKDGFVKSFVLMKYWFLMFCRR